MSQVKSFATVAKSNSGIETWNFVSRYHYYILLNILKQDIIQKLIYINKLFTKIKNTYKYK